MLLSWTALVSWVRLVCQYCKWTCNWYFTIPCKQLHAFCSALQITSVVVKWNYNYKLLCLKTYNYYVVTTLGLSISTTLLSSCSLQCTKTEGGGLAHLHVPADCSERIENDIENRWEGLGFEATQNVQMWQSPVAYVAVYGLLLELHALTHAARSYALLKRDKSN